MLSLETLHLLRQLLATTAYNGQGENAARDLHQVATAIEEVDNAIQEAATASEVQPD